jgi:hypothetical protein
VSSDRYRKDVVVTAAGGQAVTFATDSIPNFRYVRISNFTGDSPDLLASWQHSMDPSYSSSAGWDFLCGSHRVIHDDIGVVLQSRVISCVMQPGSGQGGSFWVRIETDTEPFSWGEEVFRGRLQSANAIPVVLPSDTAFWQATQPVSAAALPLPAGAAQDGTDINAPTAMPAGGVGIRGWLSAVWTKLNGTIGVTGTFWQATQPVSGTFWQATQPVSSAATSQVDGHSASIGATGDASTANTVIGRLKALIALLPASLGQKAMAASLAVVLASDQGSLPTLPGGATRWAVVHTPAVSVKATITQAAAGVGIRNYCTSIMATFFNSAAAAVSVITVNVRDGASGAGTVLWTGNLAVSATGGSGGVLQLSDLGIRGTANTAMTIEFTALVAGCFESVAMEGYTGA